MSNKFSCVVLISGNGSNLQAIIDASYTNKIPVKITAVISNKPDAYGLQRARSANIPSFVLANKEYPTRESYDAALADLMHELNPDLIILAGFMRILSADFVKQFPYKIINIHPSLLPKFRGLNTHQRVIEAKEKYHGCSIHYVTEELDAGPIIAHAKLTIHSDDTPESLQQRVHRLEHQLYPQVIGWIAGGDLKVKNDVLFFQGERVADEGVMFQKE